MPSSTTGTRSRDEDGDQAVPDSPSKVARLYPPHYAGIQSIEAHGDEEVGQDMIPEEVNEEMFAGYGGNEDDEPPIATEEHLQLLDEQAKQNEVECMLKMPAMEKASREEVEECSGYTISTKFVIAWKRRLEKGGWFRRARLVARQFKRSVDLDQMFAPTSIMVLPKMLNVFKHFRAMTLDIKDAFLMADQPADERAFVELDGQIYKLIKCLPGQRTAASQWFQLFVGAAKKFGLEQDPMQPTLLMMQKEMYITVHVDDVFMVGNEAVLKNSAQYAQKKKGWNVEVEGPFGMNEKFHYLKREFWPGNEGCDIRCDYKQYESLAKDTDVYKKAYRKTPMDQNFAKKDESSLLEGGDITKFRSVVGRLMYLSGERPDAQFSIQSLARSMAKPTQQAWKNAWHVCSYLQGTMGFGVRIGLRKKGQSVMDVREEDGVEEKKPLIEVVTDADYAGNKNDRRSTTSFQIFIDGNLMESRVRSQKALALSSGESEFVAIVAGCSDGMLIRHLWMTMVGEACGMKVRSDSSAARAMVQRQGIGRVRHLDAALLWVQQKESEKVFNVGAIGTALNCADIGTKNLTRSRLFGLLYMLKMISSAGERIGQQEFKDLEYKERMRKATKKIMKVKDLHVGLLMILSRLEEVAGKDPEQEEENYDWSWMIFILCALCGALSITGWLRRYMMEGFLGKGWRYMVEKVTAMFRKRTQEGRVEKKNVGSQAHWMEDLRSYLQAYEENEIKTQDELNKKDPYIEELENGIKEIRLQRQQALKELEISEAYGLRLLKQTSQYRVASRGSVIHFCATCPHYRQVRETPLCRSCMAGGTVLDSHERTASQA